MATLATIAILMVPCTASETRSGLQLKGSGMLYLSVHMVVRIKHFMKGPTGIYVHFPFQLFSLCDSKICFKRLGSQQPQMPQLCVGCFDPIYPIYASCRFPNDLGFRNVSISTRHDFLMPAPPVRVSCVSLSRPWKNRFLLLARVWAAQPNDWAVANNRFHLQCN